MRPRHRLRYTPHAVRVPIGSSTEGPSGTVHMRPRHTLRRTPHTVRGHIGSSTEGPLPALPRASFLLRRAAYED
eukprot:6415583-Pyramimonas_sp.AAC.1